MSCAASSPGPRPRSEPLIFKQKGAPVRARLDDVWLRLPLLEPARSMSEQRVDLARLRSQVGADHRAVAIIARHIGQQPLELLRIAVDRLPELGVGCIAPADLVEGLLTLWRVETPREGVPLSAIIAFPGITRLGVIDHPRN